MRTPKIKTDRLILREIKKDDVNEIFNCWMQDDEVSKYMWWKASNDISDTIDFVNYELQQIENDKWNRWIITLKETNEIIGTCLVFYNEEDVEPHFDISYNLGRKYWKNGYVLEAMKVVMEYAEASLGMTECITSYAKVNTASAIILHKLGFVDEKEISYECSGGEIITDGVLCRYISKIKNK